MINELLLDKEIDRELPLGTRPTTFGFAILVQLSSDTSTSRSAVKVVRQDSMLYGRRTTQKRYHLVFVNTLLAL